MDTKQRYRSLIADNARWEGFEFRDGDIVISTPPKCGTTWTQMITALLIFQTPDLPMRLDLLSPWLDQHLRSLDSVVADLEAQTHRRFIKSHTPLDGLPFDDRVTYITVGRDTRDVAFSWANHMDNLDLMAMFPLLDAAVGLANLADVMPTELPTIPDTERERAWQWIDDDTPMKDALSGLPGTLHHLKTFWDVRDRPNVVLLHYGEMKNDLPGEMIKLAARLGIDISEDKVRELAPHAEFESMRDHAVALAPNSTEPIWQDTAQFFHRGSCGQWKGILDGPEDDARYAARVAQLIDPELSAWVHQGPLGA